MKLCTCSSNLQRLILRSIKAFTSNVGATLLLFHLLILFSSLYFPTENQLYFSFGCNSYFLLHNLYMLTHYIYLSHYQINLRIQKPFTTLHAPLSQSTTSPLSFLQNNVRQFPLQSPFTFSQIILLFSLWFSIPRSFSSFLLLSSLHPVCSF